MDTPDNSSPPRLVDGIHLRRQIYIFHALLGGLVGFCTAIIPTSLFPIAFPDYGPTSTVIYFLAFLTLWFFLSRYYSGPPSPLLNIAERGVWSWEAIARLGQSRVLRSASLIFILCPIISRLLAKLPPELTIPLWQDRLKLPTELPFTWQVLFAGSICSTLALVIYEAFCPVIVKNFRDFSAYKNSHRRLQFLFSQLPLYSDTGTAFHASKVGTDSSLTCDKNPTVEEQYAARLRADALQYGVPIEDVAGLSKILAKPSVITESELAVCFYTVRDLALRSNFSMRLLASLLYMGAFFCTLLITFENVRSVFQAVDG